MIDECTPRELRGRLHCEVTRSFPLDHEMPLFAGESVCMTTDKKTQPAPVPASRTDLHCHSTASEISKLGVQRTRWPARVRNAARGGLCARQAPGNGLRDDHRPRHDRWRPSDRRPSRRLHLRGADGLLPRRAAGGPRPLLRDHPGGPRVAAGAPRGPRALRRIHVRARHRLRPGPPLLHRRRAAEPASPQAPGIAVRDLGGTQWRSCPRAEPARRPCTWRPGTGSGSAAATTTPASTSGGPTPKLPRPRSPAEFLEHLRAGRAVARGQQGSPAKWAHAAIALAIRTLGGESFGEDVTPPDPRRVLEWPRGCCAREIAAREPTAAS